MHACVQNHTREKHVHCTCTITLIRMGFFLEPLCYIGVGGGGESPSDLGCGATKNDKIWHKVRRVSKLYEHAEKMSVRKIKAEPFNNANIC